jgi:hypothetical protein
MNAAAARSAAARSRWGRWWVTRSAVTVIETSQDFHKQQLALMLILHLPLVEFQ